MEDFRKIFVWIAKYRKENLNYHIIKEEDIVFYSTGINSLGELILWVIFKTMLA